MAMSTEELLACCLKHLRYRKGKLYRRTAKGGRKIGNIAGHILPSGYCQVNICGERHSAHRLIYLMHHKYLPDYVDHANRNPRDNRIVNLRACTKSQNCQNQKINRQNKSGNKGVFWWHKRNRWIAYIDANNVRINLGYFLTKEGAVAARHAAETQYHGEFSPSGLSEIGL